MPQRRSYGERSGLHVEWVTIRRRTIYLLLTTAVIVVGAAAAFYYFVFHRAPGSRYYLGPRGGRAQHQRALSSRSRGTSKFVRPGRLRGSTREWESPFRGMTT